MMRRGLGFRWWLMSLSQRSAWDWERCPKCGGTTTCKSSGYARYPSFLARRARVWARQRHRQACRRTYSERSAGLIQGSWCARDVRRSAVDRRHTLGASLRRTAEVLCSWLGHQERWLLRRSLEHGEGERYHFAAGDKLSTPCFALPLQMEGTW
jgi:hypothetical protein